MFWTLELAEYLTEAPWPYIIAACNFFGTSPYEGHRDAGFPSVLIQKNNLSFSNLTLTDSGLHTQLEISDTNWFILPKAKTLIFLGLTMTRSGPMITGRSYWEDNSQLSVNNPPKFNLCIALQTFPASICIAPYNLSVTINSTCLLEVYNQYVWKMFF